LISATTVWRVKLGDRLPVIAAKVYGDPRSWRPIADANGIENPLRFPEAEDSGRLLTVPGLQS